MDSLTSAMNQLIPVLQSWKNLDFDAKRQSLNAQVTQIQEYKEQGIKNKKYLAEITKKFRRYNNNFIHKDKEIVSENNDNPSDLSLSTLLKAYQDEIDNIGKRSKFAETSFVTLYKFMYEAHNPVTVLEHCSELLQVYENKIRQLQSETNEYLEEIKNVKNQDITIRNLIDENNVLKENQRKVENKRKIEVQTEKKIHDLESQIVLLNDEKQKKQISIENLENEMFHLQKFRNDSHAQNVLLLNGTPHNNILESENIELKKKLKFYSIKSAEDIRLHQSIHNEYVELKKELTEINQKNFTQIQNYINEIKRLQDSLDEKEKELKERPSIQDFMKLKEQLMLCKNLDNLNDPIGQNNEAILTKPRIKNTDVLPNTSDVTLLKNISPHEIIIIDLEKEIEKYRADKTSLDIQYSLVKKQKDHFKEISENFEKKNQDQTKKIEELNSYLAQSQNDNIFLYQKICFIQKGKGCSNIHLRNKDLESNTTISNTANNSNKILSKYKQLYDTKMDPFDNFTLTEKKKRILELNMIDKILYTSIKMILSHQVTRTIAFTYIVLLHFLVLATLYSYIHIYGLTNS